MPIIYAAPFVFLSLLAFGYCACFPKRRKYAIQAAVAPLAFGVCSIVGLLFFSLLVAAHGSATKTAIMLCYVLPGLLGACGAVSVTNRVRDARSKKPSGSDVSIL